MHNVLIVEDHDDSRIWWQEHLADVFTGIQITSTSTLSDAKQLLKQNQFTLGILDINLPDGSGIDLLEEI